MKQFRIMYGIIINSIWGDNVNYIYIILILIIGILGVFGFWKLIKYYNYELNFKESLLSAMLTLILTIVLLVDFKLLNIYFDARIIIRIIIYFLALLLLKTKKLSLKMAKKCLLNSIKPTLKHLVVL